VGTGAKAPAIAPTATADVLAAPVEDAPEVRPPMETPSDTVGLGAPVVRSQAAAATPAAEKAAYDQAFQSLKDLRYADSADQFRAFLDQYPASDLAGNAQYWLGESYYVTKNYDLALETFNQLTDRYPDSPKVPDALLKMGYTHYELKQWKQAEVTLTGVTQQYPGTTVARLAESRLRSMRMEGHY
jgi:tol-pal system protein YbgF